VGLTKNKKNSTTGVAGVCCERRRSAQDVKGTFQEEPNAGGGTQGLTSDRGHGQGQAGGATAIIRRVAARGRPLSDSAIWPLDEIVITNIVWCIAYKREFGGGVVYCPIIVQ